MESSLERITPFCCPSEKRSPGRKSAMNLRVGSLASFLARNSARFAVSASFFACAASRFSLALAALMAFFIKDEFPEADMDKVMKMCIIHDLGEAFTGDIPTFEKTSANEKDEETLLYNWVKTLPSNYAAEMLSLYDEMAKRETLESKIYKAIDGLEALLQHNIADISTWIPREYELNMVYANDKVEFSNYLKELSECGYPNAKQMYNEYYSKYKHLIQEVESRDTWFSYKERH